MASKKTQVGCRFGSDNVMAVLLNLDASSPNSNTISLFKDGKRACEPQALPESLRGKTLYPTLTYRNYAVHVNFGPQPMEALPFTCTMVQEAATKDSAVSTSSAPKDGKYEIVFPVCLPDEGGFDWLDMFKAKCPNYTELSDRMILDWAQKSGFYCSKTGGSNDKPEMKFGIHGFDNDQVRRMISALAALQPRNYVVMEIQGNLMKEERTPSLSRFYDSSFKKVANVVLGEPSAEYKKKVQQLLLADKQATSDAQFKLKKAEEARKLLQEKQKKALQKAKRKADKEREKQAEELRKKEEQAKKEAERKKAAEEGKELPEEEPEEEKKAEEVAADEEEEEEPDEPMVDEDPPKVELTADEKKLSFRKLKESDVTLYPLNTTFQKFSIPEKDEGFDDVRYEWNKNKEAAAYLKKWILDRKQTSRVEDLVPSSTFKTKWAAWQKNLQTWKRKQNEYKAKLAKKNQDKVVKAMKKASEEKLAAAKAAAEEAKKEETKEGEEAKEETKEDVKDEDEAKEEAKEEKPEPMDVDDDDDEDAVDFDGVDIFGVEEVDDIGKGMPLYKDFEHEDWVLMSLTFELHLMVHSFKQDCNDDERLGISLEHLGFYYQKYYGQFLDNRTFGKDTIEDLVSLARDVVYVNKDEVLESMLDADIEYPQVFAKIAEEGRRHRALLVDVGEESAKLKIARPKVVPGDNRYHDRKGGMKGGNKGFDKGRDRPGFLQAGFQGFDRKGFDKGHEKGGFGKGFDKGFEKGGFRKGFDKGFDKGFGKKKQDQGKGKSFGCKGSFKGGK